MFEISSQLEVGLSVTAENVTSMLATILNKPGILFSSSKSIAQSGNQEWKFPESKNRMMMQSHTWGRYVIVIIKTSDW